MQKFWESFYQYRYLVTVALLYAGVMSGMALTYGAKPAEFLYLLDCFFLVGVSAVFSFGLVLAYFLMKALRNARTVSKPVPKLFDRYAAEWLTPERAACILAGLILMLATQFVSIGKSLVMVLNPYDWDLFFMQIDFVMHGNHYPHEWIVPFIQKLDLTHALQWFYIAWFPYMIFTVAWCILWDTDRARQMRFLWSYFAGWIVLGTLAATAFSSVGPYFMHMFYPGMPDPYTGLVTYLQEIHKARPMRLIDAANILLEFSHNGTVIDLNAISAMPSLHIAVAWLIALYGWSVNKYFFAFAAFFTAVIFTGAIYFGWHYAIDGYAAIIGISAIWAAAGWKTPEKDNS